MKIIVSAAIILGGARMAYGQQPTPPERFVDVPAEHWAYQAVENLRKQGIIVGYPDGQLRGKRTVTRYEAAVGLDRFVNVVSRQIPQKRSTHIPSPAGPMGASGAPGVPGERPPYVDLIRALMDQLRREVFALRERIATSEQDAQKIERALRE